jgi:enoyl-CoA hydratase/carnithine racemase
MLDELIKITRNSEKNKVLVFSGAGKIFSAGADLDEVKKNGLATSPKWELLSDTIHRLPCMTIAALNGTVAGGAMGMVLACDIRISVPEANFFYPVMKMGYLPQPSDAIRLSKICGPSKAKLMLLGAQKFNSKKAYDYGLIDEIVSEDNLYSRIDELCLSVSNSKSDQAKAVKKMIP